MLQSSLLPGLLFHLCSSAQESRFPVRKRIVSSPESQYERRTSTSTPSTSKMRILGSAIFFAAVTEELEQKIPPSATSASARKSLAGFLRRQRGSYRLGQSKDVVAHVIVGHRSNPEDGNVAALAVGILGGHPNASKILVFLKRLGSVPVPATQNCVERVADQQPVFLVVELLVHFPPVVDSFQVVTGAPVELLYIHHLHRLEIFHHLQVVIHVRVARDGFDFVSLVDHGLSIRAQVPRSLAVVARLICLAAGKQDSLQHFSVFCVKHPLAFDILSRVLSASVHGHGFVTQESLPAARDFHIAVQNLLGRRQFLFCLRRGSTSHPESQEARCQQKPCFGFSAGKAHAFPGKGHKNLLDRAIRSVR